MLQRIITISFLLCLIYPLTCAAVKKELPESELKITAAWARASIPGAKSSAGYMKIENPTDKDITIIGASADVANNTELHDSYIDEKGTMMMRKLDMIVVPAKGEVNLAPLGSNVANDTTNNTSGIHVMLMRLKRQLNIGDKIIIELKIKNHRPQQVEVEVK
ncbi:MAG: copper chaperone PCu(A)C [Rickettsiaceae bacterium]|nr:copper chaperone PCu(A)C [Rickettsiaceae bacterium]